MWYKSCIANWPLKNYHSRSFNCRSACMWIIAIKTAISLSCWTEQIILLNSNYSPESEILFEVPQGFLHGPLLLNIFLKVTSATKLFFAIKSPLMCNYFFHLKKKQGFILVISRSMCFCEIHWFQILWCHHRHYYTIEVTLTLISFEAWLQSNLYKTTILGTTQKWSPWTGGRLIKHHYKMTINLVIIGRFLVFIPIVNVL